MPRALDEMIAMLQEALPAAPCVIEVARHERGGGKLAIEHEHGSAADFASWAGGERRRGDRGRRSGARVPVVGGLVRRGFGRGRVGAVRAAAGCEHEALARQRVRVKARFLPREALERARRLEFIGCLR